MPWWQILLYLAVGFALLDKGALGLVNGGSVLARRLGVSPLVIGLTIVAWGTSLPEVVVSGLSAHQGNPTMALGTLVGSNIANIGLVVGASALILPRLLASPIGPREVVALLVSLAAIWLALHDRELTRVEAVGCLGLFALFTLATWRTGRDEPVEGTDEEVRMSPWLAVLLGMFGIAGGAWLVTTGGEAGALALGIEKRVVSITVFALGTSLPELTTSVRSAMKGEGDIALGNVVGSNVFNVLAVPGIVGLIEPLSAGQSASARASFEKVLDIDLPVALVFSLALIVVPRLPGRRRLAIALLAGYLSYTWWLFATGQAPA